MDSLFTGRRLSFSNDDYIYQWESEKDQQDVVAARSVARNGNLSDIGNYALTKRLIQKYGEVPSYFRCKRTR